MLSYHVPRSSLCNIVLQGLRVAGQMVHLEMLAHFPIYVWHTHIHMSEN